MCFFKERLKLEKERLRLHELELQQREEELKESYELAKSRISSLNSPTQQLGENSFASSLGKTEGNNSEEPSKDTSVRKDDLNA